MCLPASKHVYQMHTCFRQRPQDDIKSSEVELTDNSEKPCEHRKPYRDPLQEQPVS